MRLLQRISDNEFSFAEFSGDSLPRYAILSHTWGADNEEISFKDLIEGSGVSKFGYRKLRFCGEQAARDGLLYFWVDTCCIDKSSSAELAEAINSMFRWYKEAIKCYVYLADISVPAEELSCLTWESAFQRSRWFTRAWTLQELIAPKSVEFFSAEGRRLGDKKSLEKQIHEITGVSVQALQGTPLFHFSIDERMSWAASRDAKREEDKAYSLLGVFDVQMPLLYGERQMKAFIRLQEEIDKSLKRQNKLFDLPHRGPHGRNQEQPTGNVHWKVPRVINTLFTGRAKLLERIENVIRKDILKGKILVITGMGGLGKSEICLRIVNDMRLEYATPLRVRSRANGIRFWGVFWADVSKPEIAKSEFVSIAKLLGKEVSSVEEACVLLSNTKKPCLLILDNADDPIFDYQMFLPSGMRGSIVVTSRIADCNQYSTALWEALPNLDPEDSRALLLKASRIPEQQWEANSESADAIVRLLGSHTLALIQAGAYIARRHGSLNEYPKTFQQQRRRLLEFRPSQAQSRYCDVYATFEASTEVLSVDALQLLCILSMLNDSFISMNIFEKAWAGSQQVASGTAKGQPGLGDISSWDVSQPYGLTDMSDSETGIDVLNEWHVCQLPEFVGVKNHEWDPYRLEEAVYLLATLSLITVSEQNNARGISMHPLAHAWAKDRQEQGAKIHNWIAAGSAITLSRRGSTAREDVSQYLQPHVQSYIDEKIESNIVCCSQVDLLALVWSCSWMLVQMRDDARLERLLQQTFRKAGLDPTQVQPSCVPLYHLRAYSHGYNAHWQMVIDLMTQVIRLLRKDQAETNPNGIAAQHLLAIAYRANGQIIEALELLEPVIKIETMTLAESHPHLLELQHELASIYLSHRQIKEAIKLLEHIVKLRTTLAETNPEKLGSQHGLASAYLEDGQIKEAVKLPEHVVEIEAMTLAKRHPDWLASQHELARAYLEDGQIKEAVKLLEHIVQIRATTLAETHPDQLTSQHELARAYLGDRRIEAAKKLLEHVVKIRTTTLADTHPSRLGSQHELARAYLEDGQIKEAVKLLEHVVKIRASTLAETHPDQLTSQHELARAYLGDRRIGEAIKLLEHVVKIRTTTLADTHPSRLGSQHVLARAYLEDGQIEEAIKLLEHVVKISATILAETDPSRLGSQHVLAHAYLQGGQIKEAIELLEHIVKSNATTLAQTHARRLASQHVLADAYLRDRRIEEAIKLLEHVVRIEATTLAEADPSRLVSQKLLAKALELRVGKCNSLEPILDSSTFFE